MNEQMGMEEQPEAGYSIEMHVMPDGTITVFSEPLTGEEEQGEQGKGKQFKSVGEALKEVLNIYKAGGESSESAFEAGFGEVGTEKPISTMPKGGYEE